MRPGRLRARNLGPIALCGPMLPLGRASRRQRTEPPGTDGSQTCMGLFLSSGCFGLCSQFFVRSGKGRFSFFNRATGGKRIFPLEAVSSPFFNRAAGGKRIFST
jgi:hypothetical protein